MDQWCLPGCYCIMVYKMCDQIGGPGKDCCQPEYILPDMAVERLEMDIKMSDIK